jgi:bifunctional ADP-heptose synthase (sugar kinase/adenylyltransferase)
MSMGIQQQNRYKILLIGDACLDIYYFGTCDRLSPEAPVPIFKRNSIENRPGMCLNVKENLTSLGCDVEVDRNTEKIKKIRFIDQRSHQQILRVDEEPVIKNIDIRRYTCNFLRNFDAVVISDYNKGYILDGDVIDILEPARRMGIPVFVDSKKNNLSNFKDCFIKINDKEYRDLKVLPSKCELIVTYGSKGCMWQGKMFPTSKVEVHDVCGAGDVFLSTLVVRWLETRDMVKAIKTANACASLSVTKFGTCSLKRFEYENLCF